MPTQEQAKLRSLKVLLETIRVIKFAMNICVKSDRNPHIQLELY